MSLAEVQSALDAYQRELVNEIERLRAERDVLTGLLAERDRRQDSIVAEVATRVVEFVNGLTTGLPVAAGGVQDAAAPRVPAVSVGLQPTPARVRMLCGAQSPRYTDRACRRRQAHDGLHLWWGKDVPSYEWDNATAVADSNPPAAEPPPVNPAPPEQPAVGVCVSCSHAGRRHDGGGYCLIGDCECSAFVPSTSYDHAGASA